MTISRVAVIAAAGLTLAACSGSGPVAVNAPAGASSMNVRIGTDGDESKPMKVSYTCPGSGTGSVCGPEIIEGHWAKTLNAPVGTALWMQVERADPNSSGTTPNCWISDESGGRVYIKDAKGTCVLRVEPAPPS